MDEYNRPGEGGTRTERYNDYKILVWVYRMYNNQ